MTSAALPFIDDGPTPLEVHRLDARDGVVRLVAEGEVDLSTLGVFDAALGEAWRLLPTTVEVDLTGVTFCCVAGASALLAARSAAADHGVEFILLTRPGILPRVLRLVEEFASGPAGSRPPARGAVVPVRLP